MKAKIVLNVEYEQDGDLTDEQGRQIVTDLILAPISSGDTDDETYEIFIRSLEVESCDQVD